MSLHIIVIAVIAGVLGGIIGAAIMRALMPWWAKGGWRR